MATAIESSLGTIYQVTREELAELLADLGVTERKEGGE